MRTVYDGVRMHKVLCQFFFKTGYDGEELNVLDDILGEQANDEFAAELDTAAVKTSGRLSYKSVFLNICTIAVQLSCH